MKKILVILFVFSVVSCEYKHHEHVRKCKISQYQTGSADNNDLLFWYILFNNNSGTYYYYSSPTPVYSFSTVNWEQSQSMPSQLNNMEPTEVIEEPLTELPDEIEVEMEPTESQEGETDNSNSENSSESSGGESSSDGGSGDAGGDSGGGDGGE